MRLRKLLAPALMATLLAAGCTTTPAAEPTPSPSETTNGLEELEADEILERATDALDEAGSFRLSGTGESDGEVMEVDFVVVGEQLEGSISMMGFTLDLVVTEDGTSYVRGAQDLFAAFLPPEAQALLAGLADKYIKVPAEQDPGLVPSSEDFLAPEGEFTKGEVTEYEGQPAITLVDGDTTLYISLVGEPYPLAVVTEGVGTMTFSDFGKDFTIEAPDEADILDLEQLLG
jgi:hypothetical protein